MEDHGDRGSFRKFASLKLDNDRYCMVFVSLFVVMKRYNDVRVKQESDY